jgi:hypothetical protein
MVAAEQAVKNCPACGETKPLDEFYRHRRQKDGRQPWCKLCHRARNRAWRRANPEWVAEHNKKWRDRHPGAANMASKRWKEQNSQRNRAAEKRWREQNPSITAAGHKRHDRRHPERASARQVVRDAVRRGRISKPSTCEGCDETFDKGLLHGHHEDYGKPLEIEWLCTSCHTKRHKEEAR